MSKSQANQVNNRKYQYRFQVIKISFLTEGRSGWEGERGKVLQTLHGRILRQGASRRHSAGNPAH